MSVKNSFYSQGYTLLELMIGIVASMVIVAGSISAFIALSSSSTSNLETTRLVHELRSAMAIIISDIRRAGYSASASNDLNAGGNNNPFMTNANDIQVPVSSCVLFTYDRNKDGSLPPLNSAGGDERYGYRLNNGAIQTRRESDLTFDCNQGNWENLTDPNTVSITNLSFSYVPTLVDIDGAGSGTSSMTIRNITVSMTGQLVRDNTVVRSMSENVRVRNDRYTP